MRAMRARTSRGVEGLKWCYCLVCIGGCGNLGQIKKAKGPAQAGLKKRALDVRTTRQGYEVQV